MRTDISTMVKEDVVYCEAKKIDDTDVLLDLIGRLVAEVERRSGRTVRIEQSCFDHPRAEMREREASS